MSWPRSLIKGLSGETILSLICEIFLQK
jgi:hypothetical protein